MTADAAVESAQAAIASSEAEIAAAEAEVTKAELNLSYTEIHSPIAGRVGTKELRCGESSWYSQHQAADYGRTNRSDIRIFHGERDRIFSVSIANGSRKIAVCLAPNLEGKRDP